MGRTFKWSTRTIGQSSQILPKAEQEKISTARDPLVQRRIDWLNVEEGLHYQQKLARLVIASEGSLSWRSQAACRHVPIDIFFPEKHGSSKKAKAVCDICDARQPCLEYALAVTDMEGVWGGTSRRERQALREQCKQSA